MEYKQIHIFKKLTLSTFEFAICNQNKDNKRKKNRAENWSFSTSLHVKSYINVHGKKVNRLLAKLSHIY